MADMKLSACIEMLFTDLPFTDRILAAHEAGCDAVEFWGWRSKDLETIADTIDETGLTLAALTTDCGGDLCDPEATREWVEDAAESLEAAETLNARGLIVTTGDELIDIPREQQREAIVEGLEAIAAYAREKNIELFLEPLNILVDHAGYFLSTSEEGFEVVDEVDSPNLSLLYDVYHQQITEGHLISTIRDNIDRIGHFHIADVPGRHEPGTGEINYENVFHAIAETEYDGFVGMEFRPTGASDEAIRQVQRIAGVQ